MSLLMALALVTTLVESLFLHVLSYISTQALCLLHNLPCHVHQALSHHLQPLVIKDI
jgi:hypothetical protein